MLIIVCGLPGTGKSTLARALADRLGAENLNSDVVRKKATSVPTYSEGEKLSVYRNMCQEAESLLGQGKNVVLDATFSKNEYLGLAKGAAERAGAGTDIYILQCTLSDEEARRRIRNREKGPSDADFQVYLKLKKNFEPIKEEHLAVLDAAKPVAELVRAVESFIGTGMDEKGIGALRSSLGNPELITTHISWLLLDKEAVYKIKRPVKFSFLDFTTLARRKLFCEEEVRLNRRLAPDIYLGVVPVTSDGGKGAGSVRLGGKGAVIDYAVKMRRLPQDRRMDALLEAGRVGEADVRKIAGMIADFHGKIETIRDARYGSAQVVRAQIDDLANFRGTVEEACGMGAKVDFVLKQSDDFIGRNSYLFAARQKAGKIKDCHGDLHSANIFIPAGGSAVIFDCIEFNRDFRYVDVASEIAFMAMDLDAFGRQDLSEEFVGEYLSRTRDTDQNTGLKTILNLYKCYRANVRAKVAAIDYSAMKSGDARKRIIKYITLAEGYAKGL